MMTNLEESLTISTKQIGMFMISSPTIYLIYLTWQRVLASTLLDLLVCLALAGDRFGSGGDTENVFGSRSVLSGFGHHE